MSHFLYFCNFLSTLHILISYFIYINNPGWQTYNYYHNKLYSHKKSLRLELETVINNPTCVLVCTATLIHIQPRAFQGINQASLGNRAN